MHEDTHTHRLLDLVRQKGMLRASDLDEISILAANLRSHLLPPDFYGFTSPATVINGL